jgi:Enolase C-terminal domain-like
MTVAETFGVQVVPHSAYFGPELLASIHCLAAMPAESLVERYYCDFAENPLGEAIHPTGGRLAVPQGPGLGVDPDPRLRSCAPAAGTRPADGRWGGTQGCSPGWYHAGDGTTAHRVPEIRRIPMANTPDSIGQKARSLEDEFFRNEDQRAIQRLRELREREVSREGLSKASGIKNVAILDKLLDLGVRNETVAALAVVPLAEVAWADGSMDAKEERAILKRAEEAGVLPGSPVHDLLKSWLERRPEPKLLAAWTHMVEGICEHLTPEQVDGLRTGLVERAQTIAMASGGLLGMGGVSRAEQEMIQTLAAAFRRK